MRHAATSPDAETGEQSFAGLQLNCCPFSSWNLLFAELRSGAVAVITVAGIEIHMFIEFLFY